MEYNCKDLYDQSARAYSSEHPTVDIHRNGIRCVMAWQSQKIRRAMFFLLINGVL